MIVVYPESLARRSIPQLWSLIFFIMLFILRLDREFSLDIRNFENTTNSFVWCTMFADSAIL